LNPGPCKPKPHGYTDFADPAPILVPDAVTKLLQSPVPQGLLCVLKLITLLFMGFVLRVNRYILYPTEEGVNIYI
jgi:hypothetical protein